MFYLCGVGKVKGNAGERPGQYQHGVHEGGYLLLITPFCFIINNQRIMFMKYFRFDEFFYSAVADACGINNIPAADQKQFVRGNIMLLVDHVLNPIREYAKSAIFINSGFRCPELNNLVGGKELSQHLSGRAADFSIYGMSAKEYKELAYWCADNLDFDQLIVYARRRFIHVSYVSPEFNRHEVLFT